MLNLEITCNYSTQQTQEDPWMKDYAKKTCYKTGLSHTSAWTAVIGLCSLLLLACWGIYYKLHPPLSPRTKITPHMQDQSKRRISKVARSKILAKKKQSQNQPTFDFYSMLTQSRTPNSSFINATNNTGYYLQISMTSSKTGAEKLSTQLGTEGYASTIKKETHNKLTVFKVLVGPYSTLTEAKYNQMQLKALKNQAIIIFAHQNHS